MNHFAPLSIALAIGFAFGPTAPAQDQATTLLACSRDADVVVRATVIASIDPSPEWHRLQFRADDVLKGTVAGEFALMEPAGACCGRSLFSLAPGDVSVLFLRRTGALLHPLGGGRGVVAAAPAVVQHVQALLTALAGGDAAVASLLAANLDSPEPRIAADAAHALAVLPTIPLGTLQRDAVTAALRSAVDRGAVTAAPLLDVAARLGDPAMLDAIARTYLAAARDDQRRLLRLGLARCEPNSVLGILPAAAGDDDLRQLRATEVLAQLPPERSAPVLRRMLESTRSPRVQMCATEALLAAGARAEQFERLVPAVVLRLAEERHDRVRKFRSIRPERP